MMVEMEMASLKIGPSERPAGGEEWSHRDQSEIVQIRVSYDIESSYGKFRRIRSLQFLYLKDGQLSISEILGDSSFTGSTFQTIKVDYPAEYITGVEGSYDSSNVLYSLIIKTNRRKYGPFGLQSKSFSFSFKFGPENEFGGFHGTHDSKGVTSIGVYLNPPKFSPSQLCHKCLRQESEADNDKGDDDHDNNQVLKID